MGAQQRRCAPLMGTACLTDTRVGNPRHRDVAELGRDSLEWVGGCMQGMGSWAGQGTPGMLLPLLASGGAPALPLRDTLPKPRPTGPSHRHLPDSLFQQGRPLLMVPETHILSPTMGSYALLLAAVLSHVIQQMGLVTCMWLLVRGSERPNQAHRPKMVQTALGMLGSRPGNNKKRVAWGHCMVLPCDWAPPLRNPPWIPPSPVDTTPPRAACIRGLALDFNHTSGS